MPHLGEEIARRRAELNLTDSDLARSTGMHLAVLWRLEDTGKLEPLSVSQVDSLESKLGLPLLEQRNARQSWSKTEKRDAKTIGAFLRSAEGEGAWTREDLAICLKWNLSRMQTAVNVLDRQLRESGLMLATDSRGVMSIDALQNESLSVDSLPAGDVELSMSDDDLEIVLDLADYWLQQASRPLDDFDAEDRKRIARMLKLGILDHASGVLTLSAVTADALDPMLRDTRPYIGWSRRPSSRNRTP